MCDKTLRTSPYSLHCVPDQYKTQEMCKEGMHIRPTSWENSWENSFYVPDHFKTQVMWDDVVKSKDLHLLQYVLDWFVTQEQVKIWCDDNERCDDNEIVE